MEFSCKDQMGPYALCGFDCFITVIDAARPYQTIKHLLFHEPLLNASEQGAGYTLHNKSRISCPESINLSSFLVYPAS